MAVLLEHPSARGDDAGFDAAAFDAALLTERQRAAAGGYQASCDALEALLLTCPPSQAARRAEVLALLAHQYPRLGKLTSSARCATEALTLAERLNDDGLRADALTSQCYVYAQLLMGREALESGMRALSAARRLADPVREAWALNRVAAAYCSLENPTQACASVQQAMEIAALGDSQEVRFSCCNNLAYFWLRRVDEAKTLGGDSTMLAAALANARRTAERALDLAREASSPFQVAVALSNLVNALLAGDLLDDAMPLLNEFGHIAHDNAYRSLAIEADAQRAVFLGRKGSPLQAAQMLEALLHASSEPPPQLRRLLLLLLCQ